VTSVAGTTQCQAAGTKTPYNACTTLTDCVAGHACVGGACKSYCEQNTDCTATNGTCIQVQYDENGTSKPIPGMKVCSKQCKLENPAADCGPGLGCYPDTTVTPTKTDCATAGTSTSPGACLTKTTECAPGYACLTSGDCRKWCRVGFNSDCGTGKTCGAFSAPNQLFVGGIEYGVCSL